MGLARMDSSCRSRKLMTYTKHRITSTDQRFIGDPRTSERGPDADAVLPRRTREAQPGVERRHVVLVGEIRAEQRGDDLAVPPGQLRVHDVARLDAVAARLVL